LARVDARRFRCAWRTLRSTSAAPGCGYVKAVLERLFRDHPSSRQLGKRLGVSHTTIANKLRQHGLGKE